MSRKGKIKSKVNFMKKYAGFAGFLVLSLFLCVNCNAQKKDSSKQTSSKNVFGNYPADYGIAYMDLEFSKPLTVRDLFGPNAPYTNTFTGAPSLITVESVSGSKDEFSATVLISLKDQKGGEDKKALRIQMKFKPDTVAEKSYVRYIKLANLLTGTNIEEQSRGGQKEDGQVVGMFFELMQFIWDTEKLR